MKIQQENLPFRPITIKLEKKSEAEAFFNLMDRIDCFRCNEGDEFKMTKDEIMLIIALSNARTNMEVIV